VVVVDPEVVVDAPVVVELVVVVVEAAVVEVAIDVLVTGAVSVVVANVDRTSVACPVDEQATISSKSPTVIRIGIP
jgi:hypothetical protein